METRLRQDVMLRWSCKEIKQRPSGGSWPTYTYALARLSLSMTLDRTSTRQNVLHDMFQTNLVFLPERHVRCSALSVALLQVTRVFTEIGHHLSVFQVLHAGEVARHVERQPPGTLLGSGVFVSRRLNQGTREGKGAWCCGQYRAEGVLSVNSNPVHRALHLFFETN